MGYLLALLVLLAMLLPGLTAARGPRSFYLGDRRAGTLAVTTSLLATCLGASATVGVVGLAYRHGGQAFWWLGAGGLGLFMLGLLWAAPMRRSFATQTLPQWIGEGFGTPARVLVAVLIDLMWIAVIAAQWSAAAAVLSALTGIPPTAGVILSAVTVVFYTVLGGQRAVLRTDIAQLAAIVLALAIVLLHLPAAMHTLPIDHPLPAAVPLGWLRWTALAVVVGGMYIVGPDMCSRMLIARDTPTARRGAVLAGVGLLAISVAVVSIGICVRRLGVSLESDSAALPWLVNTSGVLSRPAALAVNVGLLAAMLSSADTCLLTAASVFELDLLGRAHTAARQERLGRLAVAVAGALAAAVALFRPAIIGNLMLAYGFYAGGLLLPLLLLAFPRAVAALARPWVWAAMAVGGVAPVALLLGRPGLSMEVAGLGGAGACAVILAAGAHAGRRGRNGR